MAWSFRLDSEVAGIAALVAADAAAFLSGVNPSLFTIRTFRSLGSGEAAETSRDIRMGMAIGTALALVAGLGGSAVTRSWWPLLATIATLVVLCGAYELALQHPHNRHRSIADQGSMAQAT